MENYGKVAMNYTENGLSFYIVTLLKSLIETATKKDNSVVGF